jgi:hypothetical protein
MVIGRDQNTRAESNSERFLAARMVVTNPEVSYYERCTCKQRAGDVPCVLSVLFRHSHSVKLMQEIHRLTDN